ncbi:MAG: ABC transporter ATP-binding protein [Thermodesulfobacteriota bacterium]
MIDQPGESVTPELLLRVMGLTKFFGGLCAVADLDLEIRPGELVALIGPNGAGKTTAFNLISGFLPPTRGRIYYSDRDITRLKAHSVARLGLVRSFQSNVLFAGKTVKENLLIGFYNQYRTGFWQDILGTRAHQAELEAMDRQADELLQFFDLTQYHDVKAGSLTHGHQRILGVAMALASRPRLLLLDEPVSGLNDEETTTMMRHIRETRDRGITIILVEHDMKAVMGNCERIVVMHYGRKIAEGTPQEIVNHPLVIEAYLGNGDLDV